MTPNASLERRRLQARLDSCVRPHTGCAVCGVVPVVTSDIEGRTYAVVNVNALEGLESSLVRRATVTFKDEDADSRLKRRARGWMSRVRFVGRDA